MNQPWNEHEEAQLEKLWAAGKTAGEIAKTMPGRTRSAIMGRVHRMGLAMRKMPAMPNLSADGQPAERKYGRPRPLPTTPRVAKPKPPRATKPAPAPKPFDLTKSKTDSTPDQRAEKAAAGRLIIAAANDAANDNSVLLMERRFGQCAWPVGQPDRPAQQLCCGGPVPADANRSIANYCTGHAQRAVARVLTGGAPDSAKYERAMRRWAA